MEILALAGHFRPSALSSLPSWLQCLLQCQHMISPASAIWRLTFFWWDRAGHSLGTVGLRGANTPGMHGTLVKEGLWLLHRFKSKATLSPSCARVSEAEEMWVMKRKGGLPACVHKEVHAAAVVIVLIKDYFPEFLLWHLRALPRMPFQKLLFDFQSRCSYTHARVLLAPSRSGKTHNPISTWLLSPVLTGKGGRGG